MMMMMIRNEPNENGVSPESDSNENENSFINYYLPLLFYIWCRGGSRGYTQLAIPIYPSTLDRTVRRKEIRKNNRKIYNK